MRNFITKLVIIWLLLCAPIVVWGQSSITGKVVDVQGDGIPFVTVLEDGTECESVANRLLLFDATKPHHSTTCTDQKRRVNINVNYM